MILAALAAITISPAFHLALPPATSPLCASPPLGRNHWTEKLSVGQSAPQDNGRLLGDVFKLLDERYVRDLGSEKLLDSGLKALFAGLDPHSQYFSPQEAKEFRRGLQSKFGGIGVIFKPKPSDYPEVAARFLNAPAARAGIQKGDLVVAVDGQSTRSLDFQKFASRLRGQIGTTVNVSVRSPGSDGVKTILIRRADIKTPTVRGLDQSDNGLWLDKESGIGYIRISRFAEDTYPAFRSAFSKLKKIGVRALVIDLRSDYGGLLSAAVKTADMFVDSGLIVRSVGRGGKEEKWMAHKGEEVTMPLAVLVNGDTASSAEVLAACLQDHHRAVIVGARSYGKGSIQRLFSVGKDGAMVKLTTALYFPASGRNIDKLNKPEGSDEWGITPDPGLEVILDKTENETWVQSLFAMDDNVGTDMEIPPYAASSDKVLMAAKDALVKSLRAS